MFQPTPKPELPETVKLPYDFLRQFLPNDFINTISHTSQLYCIRQQRPDKQSVLTSDNIMTSIGIMYLSGYLSPAQRRLYWENREDSQHMFVKRAMSRNTFEDVLAYTYFVEPEDQDARDAFWKIRPLINQINTSAKELFEQPEFVSVDETMVRYFGPHPLKQTIREKPERFGWKLWCMASSAGELLACQPYAGAKTLIPDVGLGQGPNVVYGLSEQYGLQPGTKLTCDNLFTSFDLLEHMAEKGVGVTGTMRQNRMFKVPLQDKKTAAKNMARGDMETVYQSNICVTAWKDSQAVFMASNFAGPEPAGTCQRYGGTDKGYVTVPCPNSVLEYNKNMGGVDMLNQSTKNYAIVFRKKKWYWSLWIWFLNVQMVQAWRLFRRIMRLRHLKIIEEEERQDLQWEEAMNARDISMPPMNRWTKDAMRKEREEEKKKRRKEEKKVEEIPLLAFTRECVEVILNKHSDLHNVTRHQCERAARPSANTQASLRFDHTRPHFVIKSEVSYGVCQHCKKRSGYRCEVCQVALHPDCFRAYHVAS